MENSYEVHSSFNTRQNIILRRVVRLLSENSRASVSEIAEKLQVSRRTVAEKIKIAKKELGMKFTLEFNEPLLGLSNPHLTLVKFSQKPDFNKIKEIFEKSEIPQIVASVKGTYDLLVYSNYFSASEYARWDKRIRFRLSEYSARWGTSEVIHRQLGFFPLRNKILKKSNISEKYIKMLELLNDNARISFAEISKKLGMHFNTVAYNFNRLLKKKYINRFTLTLDPPKNISFMTFFSRYSVMEGYEDASALARKAFMDDDTDSLISRFLICAPLIGSYDFFTMGAFDNKEIAYKHDVLYHKKLFKNYKIKMEYGEIDKVLIGRLPIRSIDTKSEYKTIHWV